MTEFVKQDYRQGRLAYAIKLILEMFEKLAYQWNQEKVEQSEEETNAENAYKLAKQARDNSIEAARSAEAEKTRIRSGKESQKSQAESDKAEKTRIRSGKESQ